jgi:hypothetical protein
MMSSALFPVFREHPARPFLDAVIYLVRVHRALIRGVNVLTFGVSRSVSPSTAGSTAGNGMPYAEMALMTA